LSARPQRRIAAVALASAALVGLGLSVPTAASAATTEYDIDCVDMTATYANFPVVPGNTVTLNLTGFDSVYDFVSGNTTPVNPAGETFELAAGDEVIFYDDGSDTCSQEFYAWVFEAAPETVPSGSHLFTQEITIPLGAPQVTLTEDEDGEHFLGGDEDCGLSTEMHGIHVYGTLDVTVTTAGVFTFRGMYSNPLGDYVPINVFDPIGDPFLAVYSSFDPANPDAGVVGCNDDANDVNDENDAEFLSDGTIIDGHQPWFTAALAPGNYTLVLMTWEDLSDEDLANGFAPYNEEDFVVGPKSTTFELWGPEGSLQLGHQLAATGVDVTPIAATGALVLLGGLGVVLVARRRRAA
jgi:LPXTG-motif cell wall-anchored protein